MSTRTVPRGTDETPVRTRKRRARTLKVRPVSVEMDESDGAFLVFVSPTIEGRALGINYHRARLPKCHCFLTHDRDGGKVQIPLFSGQDDRCRTCRGWDLIGATGYLRKLLRAYPTVKMPVPEPGPRWCAAHWAVDHCWENSRAR